MTILNNVIKTNKNKNKNKKGFTLVELLISVAILGILTPVIVKAFIYGAELNMRSRFQQRADAAANSVYEQVASLEYEELADFFSSANGWTDIRVEEGTTSLYEYHAKKYYDALEDCEVEVAITSYPESYIIPDLSFIGADSKYLTLSSEINTLDDIVYEKILQYIKSSSDIKSKVVDDLVKKGYTNVKPEYIIVHVDDVLKDNISKNLSVELLPDASKVKAEYSVSYLYTIDPSSSDYQIKYTYNYNNGNGWSTVSGVCADITSIEIKDLIKSSKTGGTDDGIVFIYYSPYSAKDKINISTEQTDKYTVCFIEEGKMSQSDSSADSASEDPESDNGINIEYTLKFPENFILKSSNDAEEGNYKIVNNPNSFKLYSNNLTISKNGIPDEFYEQKTGTENMYRVQVNITYKSNYFSDVTGTFKAGSGNYDHLLD